MSDGGAREAVTLLISNKGSALIAKPSIEMTRPALVGGGQYGPSSTRETMDLAFSCQLLSARLTCLPQTSL